MAKTNIEWASDVWNPLVGCSRISEGCRHCYAERQAFRAAAMGISRYDGITKKVGGKIRWTGTINLVEAALELPLKWNRPRRIFVNSMSDLFHEKVSFTWIDRIFTVMARCGQHTFQVLTKRPDKMLDYMKHWLEWQDGRESPPGTVKPLSNVWLGVSVEDQATADERIPLLLQTPAAVRWVSYEPAVGPVDFRRWVTSAWEGSDPSDPCSGSTAPRLNWIVVGGESGPGARSFDLAWARQTVAQGRAAGVPVFVKQMGSQPRGWCPWRHHDDRPPVWLDKDGVLPLVSGQPPHDLCHALDDSWWSCAPRLRDRKGGDQAEWPTDLRVREYPR